MASNSNFSGKQCEPPFATTSTISSPYVTNGICREQSPSTFANKNAQVTVPAVGHETCNAPFPDFGPSSSRMIPLHSNQSYYATPVGQASPTSPFSASVGSANATINQVWDEPFDRNADQVLHSYGTSNDAFGPNAYLVSPSYATSTYGIDIPNGCTNAYQPITPFTQSAAAFVPNQTSTLMPGSKPHSCRVGCGQSFGRRTDMERHAKSHEPRRLWCDRCSRGFYRKDKLEEHMKVHN